MPFEAGAIRAFMTVDKSQFDKATKEVHKSQKKMAVQAKKSGTAFKGMWKQLAMGLGITGGIALAVRGLVRQFGDIVQRGREFEREWANVTTMLSISRTATEGLRQELRRLSPTLGDTADLARGMYQVLSASIEPAKAIRFLGEAAKSAKAGVTDTKTAVDALTTAINAYGMEAEAVTEISDIMFGIVKRGKVTYEELAHSLGTVIPIAATVGVNFRDVGAAVATLTRQGIQASKATMQLRQVMMLILGPSTEAMEIMDGLEMSYGKNALEAKGLAGWLEELKEKTKGNADIMRKIVPNARALTAALALVGKASKGYAYDQEFLIETMGFTNEAFKKQMETMDFWVETIGVSADKIKIAFYEGLISQFRESIIASEDAEKRITEATNNMADTVSMHMSATAEAVGGVIKGFEAFADWYNKLAGYTESAKEEGDEYAAVVEKQRLANERLAKSGADVTDVYGGMVEPAKGAGDAIDDTTDNVDDQVIAVDKLATGWELLFIQMRAVRAKIELLPKSIINTTEVMKQAAEAAASMSLRYKEVGFVQEEKAKKTEEYNKMETLALAEMQAGYQGMIGTFLSVLEKWAIGEIVKSVMAALTFPLNILATAGAIAAVRGIFSTIKGMEEGGSIRAGEPAIVGEGGAELFVPNRPGTIIPLKAGASEGLASHSEFYTYLTIKVQDLDDRNIKRVGEKLFREINWQLGRLSNQ